MHSRPRALWMRLRSASAAEISERAQQEIHKRVDVALRSLHAAPRANIVRERGTSAAQFFFSSRQLSEVAALLKQRLPAQVDDIVARAERICTHSFDLLGYESLDYGKKIDWHLDRVHGKRAPQRPWFKIRYLDFEEAGDVKVIWELNRHQHLVTLAKAYVLTNKEKFAKEAVAQWRDWVEQNPYPIGVNWASSLEVAFRAISWLWMKHLLAGSAVATAAFEDELRQALWLSGRHIARFPSTYFSPNTHLLGEGVALFFIGVLCPELSSAEKWRTLGWQIILEQAERQVRPDGLHFEQSNYYHVYALDFFLHAAMLASRNGMQIPDRLESTIEKMLAALLLTSQAGISPRFGDDDGGRLFDASRNGTEHMMDPLATGAVLFGRGDFKAAAGELREETVWLVGSEGVARFDQLPAPALVPHSAAFRDTGLYVMAGQASSGAAQLIIDAGPQGVLGGGHGHADALSLQLAQSGRSLLIDPGTGEYVGSDNTRNRFRGTPAHNTVQIDGSDQSIPKGPFSWESLINPEVSEWKHGENFDLFAGSYQSRGVIHRRSVVFCKPEFWLVRDVVEGTGKHSVSVFWHLAPGMMREAEDQRLFVVPAGNAGVGIIQAEDSDWAASLRDGEWSPAYGRKEPAPVMQLTKETTLPAEIATVLVPTGDAKNLGRLRSMEAVEPSRAVQGYSYSVRDEVHRLFFAHPGRKWTLQNWSSDAGFLYCREDRSGIALVAFCNGSQVAFGGSQIVSASNMVEICEITDRRRVVSPQSDILTLHRWPEISTTGATTSLEPATARSDN